MLFLSISEKICKSKKFMLHRNRKKKKMFMCLKKKTCKIFLTLFKSKNALFINSNFYSSAVCKTNIFTTFVCFINKHILEKNSNFPLVYPIPLYSLAQATCIFKFNC